MYNIAIIAQKVGTCHRKTLTVLIKFHSKFYNISAQSNGRYHELRNLSKYTLCVRDIFPVWSLWRATWARDCKDKSAVQQPPKRGQKAAMTVVDPFDRADMSFFREKTNDALREWLRSKSLPSHSKKSFLLERYVSVVSTKASAVFIHLVRNWGLVNRLIIYLGSKCIWKNSSKACHRLNQLYISRGLSQLYISRASCSCFSKYWMAVWNCVYAGKWFPCHTLFYL